MTDRPDWTTPRPQVEALLAGRMRDPFSLLGAHPLEAEDGPKAAVRVLIPGARRVVVSGWDDSPDVTALETDPRGFFEVLLPRPREFRPYVLNVEFKTGEASRFHDCYSFTPVLSEYDLYLFNQGNNYRLYEKLGAHLVNHQGVDGVRFAVWAPLAERVSLIGELNQWDGRRHQMRLRGASGVWEIFIPHVKEGLLYKFEILTADGTILIKSDPFAFRMETRPQTASIVHDLNRYDWRDREWMEKRAKSNLSRRSMSIYEVHLGSWRRKEDNRWLTYREAADELVAYVSDMGFNYIEFLPLAEHPFDGSWGYQVTGYYAATSRFGPPQDLMYLVDRCHAADIGVILDWVPAHFPRDAFALEYFDGTHLYEHADPRKGAHADWGTLIFNYGRNEVKNFLVANALFWLDKFHIDGLRVDAVASMLYLDYSRPEGEWTPNIHGGRENLEAIEFIKTFNTKVYELFPGVMTIAEESTAWPGVTRPVHLGGLGFMFKWNMGWMHDMLTFMSKDPVHRRHHMEYLTFALLYAFHENFILPLSHDEVVHGKRSLVDKMPGDDWRKFANLRLLLGYMYGEPGKKVLFMGGEIGQWWEWDHDQTLQWHLLTNGLHRGLQNYIRDLNRLYHREPAMFERDFQPEGFEWIDFRDTDSTVISFIRRGRRPDEELVFVFNFTPVPRWGYRIGVPRGGFYRELINSDSGYYGGSNLGLSGGLAAEPVPGHGRPYSLNLVLPPLGMLMLKAE
ncbi:MAG: 1,4-alpha-glucan branching protein GlgB [Thermodesulfobacteriota bacterium]